MFFSRNRAAFASALLMAAAPLSVAISARAGSPGTSPGRVYTTPERMKAERLAKVREDGDKLRAARKPVETQMGLTDFHSILHAHAEDSAHTGGTRPEMLEDAKRAGVKVIMLSDHYRPPRDFMDSWRGMRDGVLFIPGSEATDFGFLLYPEASIVPSMEKPRDEVVAACAAGEGLIFLSHIEARVAAPMDNLTGMEIYNNHADAMDDAGAMMMGMMAKMTDPAKAAEFQEALTKYPAEMFSVVTDYPKIYMNKWNKETLARRVVGVAANDCHHNQVFIVKMVDEDNALIGTVVDDDAGMRKVNAQSAPKLREMTAGHKPGDVLLRLDFDPYRISFMNVSTHILASEQTEKSVRDGLRRGHAYVSHDWICDPTGFAFTLTKGEERVGIMGDETTFAPGLKLAAEAPTECEMRILKNGEVAKTVQGRTIDLEPDSAGVYRIEAWVKLDGEDRVWIYSNPVYLR